MFKNVYEIYGDVKSASNSFKIDAYEQGMSIISINMLSVVLDVVVLDGLMNNKLFV